MLNRTEENTKPIIEAIENHLGFKLHDWQKRLIITGNSGDVSVPRGSGRTTAYMLFLMFSDGPPLDLTDAMGLGMLVDRFEDSDYIRWFRREFERIYEEMKTAGLEPKLREVYFRKTKSYDGISREVRERGQRSRLIVFDEMSDYQEEKENKNEDK